VISPSSIDGQTHKEREEDERARKTHSLYRGQRELKWAKRGLGGGEVVRNSKKNKNKKKNSMDGEQT